MGAFLEGWRRAARAPFVVLGLLAITIVVSLPLAAALHNEMRVDLGSSGMADDLLGGWPDEWADGLSRRSTSLAQTFTHQILGFGGTLAALDAVFNGRAPHPSLWVAVGGYLAIWIFLTGGLIERLARGAPMGSRRMVGTSRRVFWRMLRLTLIAAVAYGALFRWGHPFVFDTVVPLVAGAAPSEPRLITLRAFGYVGFLALVTLVTIVADFARIRLVVEDRLSAIGALVGSARFLRRRPGRAAVLALLNILALAILARLWLQVAPAADAPTWVAVLVSQIYLAARLTARLGFIASEVVFFQGELAHATYVATPASPWPRGVSVAALRRGRQGGQGGSTGSSGPAGGVG